MSEILSNIREGFSPKEIKMAIGIASDPRYKGGNMTGAVNAIEKIKKGLSNHKQVAAVLKRQNEENDEPASPDEGGMATDQLEFIKYAADEIMQHIQGGGEFPEWMQNKLSGTHEKMKSLHANIDHANVQDQKEEVELEEGKSSTGYELYHKDFSSAMKHAYDFAKKKFGIEVDPKEIDDKVASGPRKPSKGKTNSYRLLGKDGKKAIQVQVYGMDNGKYELNMYKESVDLEEGAFGELQIAAKDLARYAVKSGGIDKKDFMKAAAMMKTGKVKELVKFVDDLDTEPRDKIIDMVKGAVGKAAAEKMFSVSIREEVELEEAMATWKVTVVKPVNKLKKGDSVSVKANNIPQALKKSAKAFGDSNLVAVPSTHFDVQKEEVELEEKLKVSDGLGAWITDFKKSDAPQFDGKSDEEKKNMAIAAFTDAGGKLDEGMVDDLAKEFEKRVKKQGHSSRTQDRERMAVLGMAKKKGASPADMKKLDAAIVSIINKLNEEEEPQKPDTAKAVDQMRDDKKKTRIAQLQLQIAKAQETINKLNAQEKPNG